MNVIVFEDSQVLQLQPITTARPAFSITCGSLRLIDFLRSLPGVKLQAFVRPHLREIVPLDHSYLTSQLDHNDPHTIVVSARCAPCKANFDAIASMVDTPSNGSFALDELSNVAFGVLDTKQLADANADNLVELLSNELPGKPTHSAAAPAFCLPHDVIRFNQEFFNDNLQLLIEQRGISQTRDGLYVADDANVADSIAVGTTDGPVVIDSKAKVKPFAYLQGPVYIGPNCTVNEHSAIKDYVCLTHTIKAGGEIEATVIEPYSNKQHHGFLGHSYLGSWINLGAGTCNSDLKNTYGTVSAVYGDQKINTQMQFVGCFVGDYSKSAINASIYTGKSIGVCSMMYGIVPTNVPSFVNYAKVFDQITEVPAAVMTTTQARMFARRGIEQRACDIQLMNRMFELTKSERQSDKIVAAQLSF